MLTNIVLILNNNSFLSEEEDNFKRERSTGDSPVRVKTLKKIYCFPELPYVQILV